ncbi:tRNA (adenine(22)-N(1))-methyltransferase [Salinicoccus carnicancri]|uniref:tRNA (adenine(22)-N(1))-methyltransferase n=1 Tax=Salinicoccus carnicancri TaxID=558170 RepID=UPI00031BE6F4|nr:tRNA (adenine(22)-N(1))-methyltransferase TrmK [Salinicoccus carnicancri]
MLDDRLKKVASYIEGDTLVDIGSDHAYLPIYAVKNRIVQKAICGEIVKGPYDSTVENIQAHGLADRIEARFGSGLKIVSEDDDIDSITICGMGGPLIADILRTGFENVSGMPRLILQPNTYSYPVRRTLQEIGYEITDETVLRHGRHFYEIIVAERGESSYDEKALMFGPVNLTKRGDAFIRKQERELEHQKRILANLEINSANQDKMNEIRKIIDLLEEVL